MLSSSRSKLSTLLLSSTLLLGLATAAGATTVTAPANSIKGKPVTGSIKIDDTSDPGNLVITLTLDAIKGNVRGFLTQVADESLLAGLSVVGADDKSFHFDANGIGKSKRGHGNSGAGAACPCDLGIAFSAKSGTTVTFTLTHETQDLTVGLFYGQDFAVKANGVKLASAARGGRGYSQGIGSSVLEGRVPSPIPEPATATLMALGLAGLSYAGRPKQA